VPDWAEDALGGIDAPRPLPPELAERLERAIAAAAGRPEGSLPLGEGLAGRLESALGDPLVGLMEDLGAPRALPPGTGQRLEEALGARRRPRARLLRAVAAAAVVLAGAGLAVSALARGGAGPATARAQGAHARGGGASAAGPSEQSGAPAGTATGSTPASSGASGQVPLAVPAEGAARPVVSGLDPASGPASGGVWVTISGSGFSGATAVSFGTAPATAFAVVSPTELRAEAPAHAPGRVEVRVTTPAGTSAPVPGDLFTYEA
jgi:hypothetical protein